MAVGLPLKTTYANGDVYSASDVNDTNGTINAYVPTGPASGVNKIINGDFNINQRNFTSNTTNNTYNFDRWLQQNGGATGTLTVTPQTFTPGAAPVAGYEGSKFVQCVTASGSSASTYAIFEQRVEDVRTFAGQTATFSFWAKAATGTPKIGLEIVQSFGSGGSPSASVLLSAGTATLSTSWARYSITVSVPSISGKTIGTTDNTSSIAFVSWLSAGSDFASRASSIGVQNNTFQIWGVQAQAGSTATAFQTATGTIQGELAACQRYYYRYTGSSYTSTPMGLGQSSTAANIPLPNPTTLRTVATSVGYTGAGVFSLNDSVNSITFTSASVDAGRSTPQVTWLALVVSGATAFRPYWLQAGNNSSAFIEISAEL
jgi:hypothetical protein